jgi:hypothetical protein
VNAVEAAECERGVCAHDCCDCHDTGIDGSGKYCNCYRGQSRIETDDANWDVMDD